MKYTIAWSETRWLEADLDFASVADAESWLNDMRRLDRLGQHEAFKGALSILRPIARTVGQDHNDDFEGWAQ